MKKKLYITGISGFIGSKLALYLSERGYSVVGISRNNNYLLSKELGVEVIEIDLLNKSNFKLDKADYLIHCATANDIVSRNFSSGLSLSVEGTKNLLDAALEADIRNIVFFSTAQVYGTELKGTINEDSALHCETQYSLNHFFGEELCKMYCTKNKINVTALRPSNVYGLANATTVNRNTLVPKCFIEEALKKGKITLNSSGKQTRNFVSTDQVAMDVANLIENFPKNFSVRNSGSNWSTSIIEIANLVAKLYEIQFNKKIEVSVNNLKPLSSNNFKYQSKFFVSSENEDYCKHQMQNVIQDLLKNGSCNEKK